MIERIGRAIRARHRALALGAGGLVIAITAALASQPDLDRKDGLRDAASEPCHPEATRTSGPKAFPTAAGFGQFARGGRGGAVYPVTTLADTGPGSLRACAEASGPRTCVFRVSGTIEVDDWIKVEQPYLTIAGQTSPGGIAIKVRNSPNSPMLVQTHDVILRYLRLRPGPSARRSTNVDTT
jgi:hypothetical protein